MANIEISALTSKGSLNNNDYFHIKDGSDSGDYKVLPSVVKNKILEQAQGDSPTFNNLNLNGDLTVVGNLEVQGTTITADVDNLLVQDPLVVMGNGNATDVVDLGFIGIRASNNIGCIWDESADQFAFIETLDDGTTAGNVSIAAYAGLHVGALQATTGTFSGAITAAGNTSSNGLTVSSGNSLLQGKVSFDLPSEVTISTGAITVTKSAHTVDTEANAATDDLDTINGGIDGQVLILSSVTNARDVTVKDGTGNIQLSSGDFTLSESTDTITLQYNGANWLEVSRSAPRFNTALTATTGTFSGNATIQPSASGGSAFTNTRLTVDSSTDTYVSLLAGTTSNAGILFGDSGTSIAGAVLYRHNTNALDFTTNGNTLALTLDSSQNATFSGDVTVGNKLDFAAGVNGIIHSPNSVFINIDSDNTSTTEKFVVGKDTDSASPTVLFQIQEDGQTDIVGTHTTGLTLDIQNSSLTTGSLFRAYSNSSSASSRTLAQVVNDNAAAVNTTCLYVQNDATGGLGMYIQSGGARIDGIVGFGVAPASTRQVTIRAAVGNGRALEWQNSGGTTLGYFEDDGDVYHSGNVGIGAAASSTVDLFISGTGTTSANQVFRANNGSGALCLSLTSDRNAQFGGNVGIGAVPTANDAVNIGNGSTTYSGAVIRSTQGTTASATHMAVINPNGQVGGIVSNGTATAFNTTSDPRLKDFKDLPTDAEVNAKFDSLYSTFRIFDWKNGSDTDVWGFDAHAAIDAGLDIGSEGQGPRNLEIGEVYGTDEEGNELKVTPAGVDQSKAVPILLAKIKQQDDVIQSLISRIEALEGA